MSSIRTPHSRPLPKASAEQSQARLEYPVDSVEPARNNRPVVLLHGTLVDKDGIEAYRDFALQNGHPVNHKTYDSITKGHRIEHSTELASREVNLSRAEVASRNLASLAKLDRPALQDFLKLDSHLYGEVDQSVELTMDQVPGVLERLEGILAQPEEQLAQGLSGQIQELESEMASQLTTAGVSQGKAKAIAREVIDSFAPKAILIGHSAGGYVAHNMVVNPEIQPDNDAFTYDGGNGVAEALVISSPVEKGLSKPAPPGIAELPFYNYEKNVLRPLEAFPTSQLAMMNPFLNAAYTMNKSWFRSLSATNFMLAASLTSPITYATRPGNQQVEEGSDFFKTYIQGKPIPQGVSVVTFTSPLDRLSLEDRSALVSSQANGQSFSVDLGVSAGDLERERPTWTHVIMTEKPQAFKEQFGQALSQDPQRLSRTLHSSNDEGVRHEALSLLKNSQDKIAWQNDPIMKQALENVASERLPFTDSASYLAHQLLQETS